MSHPTEVERVWQIIEKVGVCMLTTCFAGGLRARPLEARPDRTSSRLLFVIDVHSAKHAEVDGWPEVGLVFIDAADKAYLSITGRARLVRDRKKIDELWRPQFEMWFPEGKDDPNIGLLRVKIEKAEYWDSPSSTISYALNFVSAVVTGEEPDMGEHKQLEFK